MKYWVVVLTEEALEYTDSIGFEAQNRSEAWEKALECFDRHEIVTVEIL